MKFEAFSDPSHQRRVSWIVALWVALALLAAGAVLAEHHDTAPPQAAPAGRAAVPAPPEAAITPSDPDAPAASDRLPPTP